MRSSDAGRPTAPHQEVEWLTPAPDGTPVTLPWPEENGPFLLTCHLARVDGRTMLVGLDIRSFTADDAGTPLAGPEGLVEVNHPALRSLRAGEIAEAARARLAATLASKAASRSLTKAERDAATRTFETLTAPGRPRPTGYRPASTQLERVAELFNQAVAAGGDSAPASLDLRPPRARRGWPGHHLEHRPRPDPPSPGEGPHPSRELTRAGGAR